MRHVARLVAPLVLFAACAGDDGAGLDDADDDADDGRCLTTAAFVNVDGTRVPEWSITTDADGALLAWHGRAVAFHEQWQPDQTWHGLSDVGFDTAVTYDAEGRVVELLRTRADDGAVVDHEVVSYRADGGVAHHRLTTGPGYEALFGWSQAIVEERRLELGPDGPVELVDERRERRADAGRYPASRLTTLAPDGAVVEAFDDDGDGATDRTATRRRSDGTLVEALTGPDGRLLARQTTWFEPGGAPTRLERDADGDGVLDVTKAWSRDADGERVEIVLMTAGGGDVWRVIRGSRVIRDGLVTDAAETDTTPLGEIDVAWRVDALWGLPVYNGYATPTTAAHIGLEVERACPTVDARIAPPPFRAHCPPAADYQRCWMDARRDEPALDTF